MKVTEKMLLDAYKEKIRAGKASQRAKAVKPYDLERVSLMVEKSRKATFKHGVYEKAYVEGWAEAKRFYEL